MDLDKKVIKEGINMPNETNSQLGISAADGPLVRLMLELPWPPSGNSSTRHTKTGRHYKNPKVAPYRAAVARYLLGLGLGTQNAKKPLLGPLSLHWVLAPPDRRATDVDNVRKEAADALTLGGLWVDDSCKVLRRELFEWTDPVPGGRVLLTIKEMTNV